MDFATYGNLKSIVWKQNPPLPEDRAGVVSCNVAFGEDWGFLDNLDGASE